jgi:hypothetical protein
LLRPAWDPTSFRTYPNEQVVHGAWSGYAWDRKDTKAFSVRQGGHSVTSQNAIVGIDPVSVLTSSTGMYYLVRQSNQLPYFDWPVGASIEDQGRAYFQDGTPVSGHTAAGQQVHYRRNGQRLIILPFNFKPNFAGAIGTPPQATTAAWPDRSGEKYDLHTMQSNGYPVEGSSGWGWIPDFNGQNFTGQGQYPACAYDESTGLLWVGDAWGRWMRLDMEERYTSGDIPRWQVFHQFSGTEWDWIGTCIDTKRGRIVSMSLDPFDPLYNTHHDYIGFRWLDTRVPNRMGTVRATLSGSALGSGDYAMMRRAVGSAETAFGHDAHAVYDPWNDQYICFYAEYQSQTVGDYQERGVWGTIGNLDSVYQTGNAVLQVRGLIGDSGSGMQGMVDLLTKGRGLFRNRGAFSNLKYCRLF